MSYARFGWDDSDVYVYQSSRGMECCGCGLEDGRATFTNLPELFTHLTAHTTAGHVVPDDVLPAVYADWSDGKFTEWDTTDPAAMLPWAGLPEPRQLTDAEAAVYLERNLGHLLGDGRRSGG